MVNFHDPAVVVNDLLTFVKLSHTLVGLYIWEFVLLLTMSGASFGAVVPTAGQYGSIYSLTRLTTLVAVIIITVNFDAKTPHACQVSVAYSFSVCESVALTAAELLIVLRIMAIWDRRKVVVAISIGLWVTNVSLLMHTSARVRSVSPTCLPRNAEIRNLQVGTISTLVTNIVLLLIMLVGLLRLRIQGVGTLSLGQLLWKQGIIWFLIASAAGALPTIFLLLDLNDVWSVMFLFPWVISLSIAATRMHRALTDFVSGVPDAPRGGSGPTSRFLQNPAVQPLKRLEVAVHSTRMWDSTVQMSDPGSYASTDGPVTYKPNELTSD
ncbi:hypothetical protein BC826DRAFT_1111201 [Russula brevipes]|nr:hypothetical protein BC826DRAFT_1111201 [Russula brevipes]